MCITGTVQDDSFSQIPTIYIYNLADNPREQDGPQRQMQCDQRINVVVWGSFNETIIGKHSFILFPSPTQPTLSLHTELN